MDVYLILRYVSPVQYLSWIWLDHFHHQSITVEFRMPTWWSLNRVFKRDYKNLFLVPYGILKSEFGSFVLVTMDVKTLIFPIHYSVTGNLILLSVFKTLINFWFKLGRV